MGKRYTITSRALLSTITMNASGMNTGRIRSMLDTARGATTQIRRPMNSPATAPQAVTDYLAELLKVIETAEQTTNPHHPIDVARPRHADRETGETDPLTAADIAWLAGLPTDPEQVTWDDAIDLASMALGFRSDTSKTSDARLIRQRWNPVAEVYDRRVSQARTTAANAKLPVIPLPVDAVAELLADELPPEFSANEIRSRANTLVDEAFAQRKADHDRRIAEARAEAERIDQRSVSRRSTEPSADVRPRPGNRRQATR